VEEERLVHVEAERLGEVAVVAQKGVALEVQGRGTGRRRAAQAPSSRRPVSGLLLFRRHDLRLPRNGRLELDLVVVGAVGVVREAHGVVVVGRVGLENEGEEASDKAKREDTSGSDDRFTTGLPCFCCLRTWTKV
jgi:hypothetical protein